MRVSEEGQEVLAEHSEAKFQLPVKIMVLDQTGETAIGTIDASGASSVVVH